MKKILTVTLNPAIDIHYGFRDFQTGRENYPATIHTSAAGKGVNVAKALHRFDVPYTSYMLLGKENFHEYAGYLSSDPKGFSYKYVLTEGRTRVHISLNAPNIPETRVCMKNYRVEPKDLEDLYNIIEEEVADGNIVAISGSVPEGLNPEHITGFCQKIAQKGGKVVLDTSYLKKLFPCPWAWMIKVNFAEACEVLGRNDISLKECTEELGRRGGNIPHCIVSDGKKGAFYAGEGGRYFVDAPKVKVIATVGAGDNMLAGILTAYSRGLDVKEWVRYGIAFGSASCMLEGTVPPNPEDVEAILKELQ